MAQAGGGTKPKPYVPPEGTYAPVEPGMYEENYSGPGTYADPPPLPPVESGYVEPGMYSPPYKEPGQSTRYQAPVEPGMYEPNYVQPGYYATRPASTYYGGPDKRPLFTGVERFYTNDMRYGEGTRGDMVQVIDPSTGDMKYRAVATGGTVYREGARLPDNINPATTSRGELLGQMAGGGTASPRSQATLGPTSGELGYKMQQGDPNVVPNQKGRPILMDDVMKQVDKQRAINSAAYARPLGGLFGGIDPNVTKGIQGIKPGTLRAHMLKKWRP